MRARVLCLALLLIGYLLVGTDRAALAADPAQRKELADIQKDLIKVTALVRQKKFDEAEQAITDAEQRLEKLKAAGLEENDLLARRVSALIAQKKAQLPVSFSEDVAPILAKNCTNCHGADPKGRLRLDSYAALKQGGMSGPAVFPGVPARSNLYQRLVAAGNARMPKDGQPLDPQDVQTIMAWIAQGAAFDGTDEKADVSTLGGGDKPAMPRDNTPVIVAKPTGSETVSFTRDIAPYMVNICGRCHGGNNPAGGLSMATFETLLRGGESGRVIVPGNPDGSRLYRLIAAKEQPVMPRGNVLITRKNLNDTMTWIAEGAKFDSPDPKKPLREIVPTEEQLLAEKLAKMTPEEFATMRKERSDETWERVFPREEPTVVESDEFLIYGNVPEARLKQVQEWAEAHARNLRSMFNVKETPLWKGKLAIFVPKERFGYEEFNLIVERREAPPELIGHSVVTSGQQDAYVVVQDVGDAVSAESPGLKISLIDQMTGAFLQRSGGSLPDWLVRGTGLALAAREDSRNDFVLGLKQRAAEALRSVQKPEDVFANGTFSPSQVGPVGYTLVEFLLTAGGPAKFGQFIAALQQGRSVSEAAQQVYRADLKALGTAYAATVVGARKP